MDVQVRATSSKPDSKIFGRILDLSQGGLKVKAEFPLNFKGVFYKGDKVFFETSHEFYDIRGRIMWTSDEGDRVGIKFDDLMIKAENRLKNF